LIACVLAVLAVLAVLGGTTGAAPAVVAPAVAPAVVAPAPVLPPRWHTLPLPPAMPAAATTGRVAVGKAQIYVATYGAPDAPGGPVVLLHGGMGSGEQFGAQLPALLPRHHVIVIDARGHGRSTLGTGALGYHTMAGDVVAVLDQLGVDAAAIVGWSDGGVVALDLA
jgi:alpha-beta hydrolase superfamily lysophospholipase